MWLLLTIWFALFNKGISVTVYENAQFVPVDSHFLLYNSTRIISQDECACLCSQNQMCLTAVYAGINQQCSLFSAAVQQGSLKLVVKDSSTSVLNFANKTLPRKFSKTEIW
jgi:hypothetical protein